MKTKVLNELLGGKALGVALIIIAVAVALLILRKPLTELWKGVTAPIKNKQEEDDTREFTGVEPTLTGDRPKAVAEGIYACFCYFDDEEESIIDQIKKIQNVADWDLVVKAFGERRCRAWYHNPTPWNDRTETLPAMIANHIDSDNKELMRAYLKSKGVENPGF